MYPQQPPVNGIKTKSLQVYQDIPYTTCNQLRTK